MVDDGRAFDPLKLLPSTAIAEDRVRADCSTSAIVLNQGSRGRIDFVRALKGATLTSFKLNATDDASITAAQDGTTALVVTTPVSLTTGSERNVSMTRADAASYTGRSEGRKVASGHRRAAVRSGMPDRTPNARAS